MSEKATRDTLLNQLITSFTDIEILYENRNKIPKGDEFLEVFFIPAVNDSTGKSVSSTQDEGIFQVTIAVKKGDYDNRQLELVDRVYQAFSINSTLSYNGTYVDVTEYSTNAGRESDGFYKRDVSIGYLTFS